MLLSSHLGSEPQRRQLFNYKTIIIMIAEMYEMNHPFELKEEMDRSMSKLLQNFENKVNAIETN